MKSQFLERWKKQYLQTNYNIIINMTQKINSCKNDQLVANDNSITCNCKFVGYKIQNFF